MIGDDVTLPCQLDPVVDATDQIVEWARPDLRPRFVHLRRQGVQLDVEENPSYKGRTSLNENKLKRGDLSLKLVKVKLTDAGKYKCFVPTLDMESVVELVVGSVSSPHIQVSKVNNGGVVECKSSGWYPEPEVVWLDAEGKLLSEPKETTRGGDGLYTVSSRVTVEKKHSNGFTCRVQQQNISQTRETRIQVPADLFMLQLSSAVRFSIVVAVSFMVVVTVFVIVWKVAQDNKETEIKEAEQIIKGIKEQKTYLNTVKEKLVKQIFEEKAKVEEYEIKINKKTQTDKKQFKQKKEKLLVKIKEDEELLENTETQLEDTDEQSSKMAEMMTQLKMDKEQINVDLKEVEKEMKEIQRKIELKQQQEEEQRADQSSSEPLIGSSSPVQETTKELQLLMKDKGKKTKASLEHKSKKLETEINEVKDMINAVKDQKLNLNTTKEELANLVFEEKKELEEYDIKKKNKSDNKDVRYQRLLEKNQKHDKLLSNIETLLQGADELVRKMLEKTKQLKMEKDQINVDLNEAENEMTEIQRKIVLKQQQEDESRDDPSTSEPLIDSSSDPVKAAPVPEVDNSSQPAAVDQSEQSEQTQFVPVP
ncbi:uncharacterized protein V6R79_000316 [Siganus canaliculatus]